MTWAETVLNICKNTHTHTHLHAQVKYKRITLEKIFSAYVHFKHEFGAFKFLLVSLSSLPFVTPFFFFMTF